MSFNYYRGRWGQKFPKVTAQNFKTPNNSNTQQLKWSLFNWKNSSLPCTSYKKGSLSHFPLWTLIFWACPAGTEGTQVNPIPMAYAAGNPGDSILWAPAWTLPPGKPEKTAFVTFCPSLPCGVNKWTRDLGLLTEPSFSSLRKHGHCHLLWETPSGQIYTV